MKSALKRKATRTLDMMKICQRARLRAIKNARTERPDSMQVRIGKPQVQTDVR